jgi:PIN domain nuclease of toxin-antitoxin system
VIVVDTHVWIWWVHQEDRLTPQVKDFITQHEAGRIGVSAISCWEVAKLVERGRLRLPMAVDQWLHAALAYPGMTLLPLTPEIAADMLAWENRASDPENPDASEKAARTQFQAWKYVPARGRDSVFRAQGQPVAPLEVMAGQCRTIDPSRG